MNYPKLFLSIGVFTLVLSSCSSDEKKSDTNEKETNDVGKTNAVNKVDDTSYASDLEVLGPPDYFLSKEKWSKKIMDFEELYIINYAGAQTEERAIILVDSLLPTYPDAGYLWIPDFESLSGKEMYAVFLTFEQYKFSAEDKLREYKEALPKSYIVKVTHNEDRWVSYSPLDTRINNEKQPVIAIYSNPVDEEEYASEGGEDWGWFVNDVTTYFSENHPEVIFTSIYHSGLTNSEIKKIESNMELEGFGYILIDRKKREFVGHDMPDGVISLACEFFGYENKFE